MRTNFSNNSAFVSGGAIRLESVQEVALVEVHLVANIAKGGGGGAISMLQVNKTITLINSVLQHNTADKESGGAIEIVVFSGQLSVKNCTFYKNSAKL